MRTLRNFWTDERGLETAEWALLLGIVVLAGVMAAVGARGFISQIFGDLNTQLGIAAGQGAGGG